MCNFWSCILTREGKVLWSPKHSSHEQLLADYLIPDAKLEDREFVRIEVHPTEPIGIFSKKKADWTYKVDEPKTVPRWYSRSPKLWEGIIWRAWRQAMKETLWKLGLKAVEEVIQEVRRIDYFDMHGEPDPEWILTIRRSWAAARAAAGAAAGDAALYARVRLIPDIDPKHLAHADARMEVWRRGYALFCDVNGKLYVYGVKKEDV